MIAPEYFNNHIAVEGEIIVKGVPNDTGSVLVWNSTTKKISTRTHADIIADLSLMTTNTNQIVTGLKSFITSGGNYAPFNNSLQIYSDDGSSPSMTYSKGGVYVGQTMFNEAGFHFKNGDNNAYYNVRAKGFIKENGDNNSVLLDGGGSKPISEFALSNHVHKYLSSDATGVVDINNLMQDGVLRYDTAVYSGSTNMFPAYDAANAVLSISSFGGYNTQLGFNTFGDIYTRSKGNAGNTITDWKKIITSAEFDGKIGARNLIQDAKNFGFYATDASRSNNSVLGEITITDSSGFWNAYSSRLLFDYTPGSELLYQVEISHNNSTPIDMTFYFYNDGDSQVFNQVIPPNVWTKVTRVSSPNHTTSVLMGIGGNNTDIGTKIYYRNKQVEEGIIASTYRPAYEDFVLNTELNTQLNSYWKKHNIASTYWAFKSDRDIAILTENEAHQRILTGGILASDYYADRQYIPNLGIYSKGDIRTAGQLIGNRLSSADLVGNQIVNISGGDTLYMGNSQVAAFYLETANNDLFHNRIGYGVGKIWDAHNHNPFKNLRGGNNIILEEVYESGIYRQENPTSGYNYTTTLNLNSTDGRQQISVERTGGGMKFRGTYTGSGNTGWSDWKDVIHSGNLSTYLDNSSQIIGKVNAMENVVGLGFHAGNVNGLPYIYTNGNEYKTITTDVWVDANFINLSQKGIPNGVATLDSSGLVPATQLPSYVDDVLEFVNLSSFPSTGENGKIYVAIDTNQTYRWSGSTYIQIASGAVQSVNGQVGIVNLTKSDIGLGNVDNTADISKKVIYAKNASKLYANGIYDYDGAAPYYGFLKFKDSLNRWRFEMSPATPADIEVAYSDTAGNALNLGGISAGDYVTRNTDQSIDGKKVFNTYFDSYTPDGLFDNNARTLKVNTPSSQKILFGYKDYGSGQYYPRIGFTSDSSLTKWSVGPIGNNFVIGINNDGAETFRIHPSGATSNTASNTQVFQRVYQGAYPDTSHQTGMLVLKMPQASPDQCMFSIDINVYGYESQYLGKINVAFYKYASGLIINNGAKALFNVTENFPTDVARIGIGSDGLVSIILGQPDTFWNSYISFEVERVQTHYANYYQDWSSGWSHTLETDLSQYGSNIIVLPTDVVATKGWVATNINNQLGNYWEKSTTAGYTGINAVTPFSVLNNGYAQKIYAGGLLISDAYQDEGSVPSNGIYSKSHIITGANFYGKGLYSPNVSGGQIINANSGSDVYFGNPNIPQIWIESADSNIYHNRSGHGAGIMWDAHNFNPDSKIPTSHPIYGITQNEINGWRGYLGYWDNRQIQPAHILPTKLQYGFTAWDNNNTGPWADYLHFGGYPDSSGGSQNLILFKKNGFGLRQYQGSSQGVGNYSSYVDYWHSDNFNPDFKVNKSGDTMNGMLNFDNNVGGISGTMGDNDFYRIIGRSNGSDNGYLEIATADGGIEPIHVTQYSGLFVSPIRTAKLLDENGNTYFPQNVTAEYALNAGSDSQISGRIFGKRELIDATGLNEDTYYPVAIKLPPSYPSRIKVYRTLDGSMGVPSYSTHGGGFWCYFEFDDYGKGWGVTDNLSVCNYQQQNWTNIIPVGYSTILESSDSIIWVRGGSKYWIDVNSNTPIVLYPNGYTSPYGQTVNPTRIRPWVDINRNILSKDLLNYVTQSSLDLQLGNYCTLNQLNDYLPNQNWVGHQAILNRKTIGEIAWKAYGNGHTIFDISNGTTPWGATVSNQDAQQPWSPTYPTLVGGNGVSTYGVRVDSARTADSINGYNISNFVRIDIPQTVITRKIFNGGDNNAYTGAAIEIQGNGSTVIPGISFHQPGVVASQIRMDASGQICIVDNPGSSYENFRAKVITGESFTSTIHGNSSQWVQAYNWGNHASAGYASQNWVSNNYMPTSHIANSITYTNILQWNDIFYYGLRLNNIFTSNTGSGLMIADDYFGSESGLVDANYENFVAGKQKNYYKYGSLIYDNWDGLNYHIDTHLFGIGKEVTNKEDKVQVAGDISVDTINVSGDYNQLILNPLYDTKGDVRNSRNAHIYIVTRETVRLPSNPILGQRIEIFNDGDSEIEVMHDNVGTLFYLPGYGKITGIAGGKGFIFDEKPISAKHYSI